MPYDFTDVVVITDIRDITDITNITKYTDVSIKRILKTFPYFRFDTEYFMNINNLLSANLKWLSNLYRDYVNTL